MSQGSGLKRDFKAWSQACEGLFPSVGHFKAWLCTEKWTGLGRESAVCFVPFPREEGVRATAASSGDKHVQQSSSATEESAGATLDVFAEKAGVDT